MEEKDLIEKTISSETIFKGKVVHLTKDVVSLPNNKTSIREIVHHNGAVAIIPIDKNKNIIMEKQYRYAQQRVLFEIPAGKLDSINEDHLSAAKRELKEETGCTADNWYDLGLYIPTPAVFEERVYIYACSSLHQGETHFDEDEFLLTEIHPLEQLVNDVLDNKIEDGKTAYAVLKTNMLIEKGKIKF